MRNKNIFIRKETMYSVLAGRGNMPVFANVLGYDPSVGNVVYEVDFPVAVKKNEVFWNSERDGSTIYVKPLDEFLSRFAPDLFDEYSSYVE